MAVEPVAEVVADNLEETAKVVRAITSSHILFLGAGLVVGAVGGFMLGQRLLREKIRAEEFEKTREEVEEIRTLYYDKLTAAEPKPSLEDMVEEKGYSTVEKVEERPLKSPVPITQPLRNPTEEQQKALDEAKESLERVEDSLVWDYEKEVPKRSKNHPYVVHQDEFNENPDEYQQLTWTYYANDNVLADENDEQVSRPELIIGLDNLMKFGHGSDDSNVVFVRNERLEIDFEVCRLFKSYAVEVQGLDDSEPEQNDKQTDETQS